MMIQYRIGCRKSNLISFKIIIIIKNLDEITKVCYNFFKLNKYNFMDQAVGRESWIHFVFLQ